MCQLASSFKIIMFLRDKQPVAVMVMVVVMVIAWNSITSAYSKVTHFLLEVAVQSLVLVALVAVVAEVPLLTRAHEAALAPVPHDVHAALIGAPARVLALAQQLRTRK
jgi:antibiotic biosynthesis monooxygenase (ABM) superfamily enzyme